MPFRGHLTHGLLPPAEMLESTPTTPIPVDVMGCMKLIYEKLGANLAPSGAVGELTRAQVRYAWAVMRWSWRGTRICR